MLTVGMVEPVGGHGGMDYYDYGLAYGLGANNIRVLYFTCDKTKIRHFDNVETLLTFKNLWIDNIFLKVIRYVVGHIKSFVITKKYTDVVHLHFFEFRVLDYLILFIAKKVFRLNIVATVHDVNSFNIKSRKIIERLSYNLISSVIVHNSFSSQALVEKNICIKKISVIAHGNYLPFITPLPNISCPENFNILFFGQIKEVKGLDILINALFLVKRRGLRVVLTICGKAWKSDLEKYNSLIKSLNLTNEVVTHFRYIPDDEVASFYSKTDLVVLPYREIYQSGVLLLSMSYGKPVLCSDLDPFKAVISHNVTGFLFKRGDPEDLADKIADIIENKKLLSMVANESISMVRTEYDWVKIGELTKQVYQNL